MATAKPRKKKSDELTIEYIIPDYIISRFATNITVQKIENEFKVSFFELKQDMILNEEDRKKMIERGTVRADCIASIIITADRMPKFIDAMSKQLEKFEPSKKEGKD